MSNKQSDRGTLLQGLTNYLYIGEDSGNDLEFFHNNAFPFFPCNSGRGSLKWISQVPRIS